MPTEEITLDEQKRTQLDENLRAMSEGGADNDAIVAYANDFKKKYGSPKSNAPSNTGGESGARITPSTSTLPSAGSESESWTKTANPLKPKERPIQVPVAKGKPMPIQEAPSDIKLFEGGNPIRQEPKKTKLGTVAFDINEVKRNVAENPIAPIPLTADQAFNEVKNLEMRTSSVDNLYKGQSKIFNAKKAVLTQYESELNAIKQQVEKAKAEGDINTANRLIESAQPIIKQYDSQAKELRKQAIKLEYLDDRKKTLESDMIGISENQQYTTNQWQALNSGLNTLTAGALRAPSFVYNTMIALQNKIAKETGVPIYANPQTDGYLQQAAKYFEDNAEAYSKVIEKKKQQADYSIQNLFENGEYAKAFNLISESVMESAPTTAAIALGGIGGVGALGTTLGGAAVFGSQTFEENKKKGIDDNTNYINSWVNGTLEGIFEATGTLQIVKHGADLFKKEGAKAVEETAKTIWQQVYGKVAKKMFPATSAVMEGVSEAETAFTQNYVNMISGVDDEYKKKYNQIANSDMNDEEKQDALSMLSKKHLFQGVPDAFYVGAAMGGGMGLMQPKQGYTAVNNDKKNEIKKAQETLDNLNKTLTNPLVSADAKDIIQSKADAEAERISLLTEEDDRQLRETLNKDEYEAVTNIQAKIETLEKSLDAIDDKDSKALVEQQIKELEVEKQGILVSSADNLATRVQEKRKELGVEFDPLEGLSDAVASTFERVEGNLPTDINAVQEASDFIYKKYKELQAMKSAKTRPLTIAQINDFMGQMEKDITMLENYKEEQRKSIERTLQKNTSPTPENYGTINRNDGKGVVDLTKEEFEAEQANMQPKADGTAPIEKPLKDVDNTAKALKEVDLADSNIPLPQLEIDGYKRKASENYKLNDAVSIAEAYHIAKADGSNPELVKAVEELLTPKTKTNEKANEDGEQKRGKDGEEDVTKSVQSEGEVGGNEVDLKEKQVLATEGAVTAAPIENPKVVIQGTRQGLETFESSNYDSKADGKVTDARGLKFDENGVSIQKDNKGNQIVHIKVDATDDFSRAGNLQVSVIVPEGTNVNTKAIKEIVDAKVAEIKAKGNIDLKLGKVQQSDFTALKDAIVNELKNPSAAKSKAEAAPNVEAGSVGVVGDVDIALEKELNELGQKQLTKGFNSLSEATKPEQVAAAIVNIEQNKNQGARLSKEQEQQLSEAKAKLKEQGYEIVDYNIVRSGENTIVQGVDFYDNQKDVLTEEQANAIESRINSLEKRGKEVNVDDLPSPVSRTIKPLIKKDGKMVQAAEVNTLIFESVEQAKEAIIKSKEAGYKKPNAADKIKAKAVEQSLKETPKAETPEKESSVGVGGEVENADITNLRKAKTKSEVEAAILKATQSDNLKDGLDAAENLIGKAMYKSVFYADPVKFGNELADAIEKIVKKQQPIQEAPKTEQQTKPITNEKSSQKTDQEGSTEGSMLEGLRDGRTQDEGGQESTELRTEEEVEPTQAETTEEATPKDKVWSKTKAYNNLTKTERKSAYGSKLRSEIMSEAAALGYTVKPTKQGKYILVDERGKEIRNVGTPRSKDEIQEEKRIKERRSRARRELPISIKHSIAQDIANGVKFDRQSLMDVAGLKDSDIPFWMTDAKGKGITLENYSIIFQEKGGFLVEDDMNFQSDVAYAIGDFAFKRGQSSALEYIESIQEKLENGGLTDAEMKEQAAEYQAELDEANFDYFAEYLSNLSDAEAQQLADQLREAEAQENQLIINEILNENGSENKGETEQGKQKTDTKAPDTKGKSETITALEEELSNIEKEIAKKQAAMQKLTKDEQADMFAGAKIQMFDNAEILKNLTNEVKDLRQKANEVKAKIETQLEKEANPVVEQPKNQLDIEEEAAKAEGVTEFGKAMSASSRFRPYETVVFDKPIIGENGNKLISYQWAYEWQEVENNEGEAVPKRFSDWTQAENSAETGRDIVHKFTIERKDGTIVTVSSETVPSLLGYVDEKQMKSIPQLATAVKTLAKQRMQLAIMEAKQKEYEELVEKYTKAEKPPIVMNDYSDGRAEFTMGDSWVMQNEEFDYYDKEKGKSIYKKVTKINEERKATLESGWIQKRVQEDGGKSQNGLYDLKNRIARQEKKVEQITGSKISIKDVAPAKEKVEQVKPKTAKETAKEKLTDPKNASDLAKTYRNKFGFTPQRSVWAARLFDAKAAFMSKVLGISKEDYYSQYWFGVNEEKGGLSQMTLPDGRKVTVKSVSAEVVNGFYSNTENALGQVKQEKMSGNQWATQLLSRGANKEEMQFTGLEAFLKENAAKPISKADIQQFLKDNRIQVVEVVKGGEIVKKDEAKLAEIESQLNSMGFTLEADMGGEGTMLIDSEGEIADYDENQDAYRLLETYNELSDDNFNVNSRVGQPDTKFSQYQAPLSRDTEVLTINGWVTVDKLNIGDVVISRCDEDGKLEWAKVEATPSYFSEKLIHFSSSSLDVLCTPQHTMLYLESKYKKDNKIRRATAEKLFSRVNTLIPLTSSGIIGDVEELYGLDGRDVGELIGWFISEGSFSWANGRKQSPQIAQTESHNPENCRRIEELLGRLKIKWSKNGNSYYLNVKTMPKELVEMLKEQPTSLNKFIPNFLFNTSKYILEGLYDGLFLGDGTTILFKDKVRNPNPQEKFYTSSLRLANDFQILLILIGKVGNIKQVRRTENTEYVINIKTKQTARADKAKKEYVDYNDIAYCVTVKNHAICIRRNGIVSFTGNSGEKENYKEVLVTMPNKVSIGADLSKVKEVNNPKGKYLYDSTYFNSIEEIQDYDGDRREEEPTKFKSSHFDEPNILVHLRMNTRVDAEGKKVVFLEEVQSDWGQKGKKEGFKDDSRKAIADSLRKEINDFYTPLGKSEKAQVDYSIKQYEEGKIERQDLDRVLKANGVSEFDLTSIAEQKNIPTAPFVTDTNAWTKLGLKVALKEAVKQGVDKIAWTTGEQQNDRYDLSKQVKRIDVEKVDEVPNLFFVDIKMPDGKEHNLEVENGKVRGKERGFDSGFEGKPLEDIVGKDIAERILNGGSQTIEGEGLKIGGKGMKGFYGSVTEGSLGILGNVAKSLFKQEPKTTTFKLDSNKELVELGFNPQNEGDIKQTTQHSIDITPELKAQASEGQPLFQDRKGSWTKDAARMKRIINMYEKADSTTAVHEMLGHDYLDRIIEASATNKESEADLRTIAEEYIKDTKSKEKVEDIIKALKEFDVENNKTAKGTSVHEWFATQAEQYFATEKDVKSETPQQSKMAKIFEAFRAHLAELYDIMNKTLIAPSEPMKQVFRKVFGEENFNKAEEIRAENVKAINTLNAAALEGNKKAGGLKSLADKLKEKGLGQSEFAQDIWDAASELIANGKAKRYNVTDVMKEMFPAIEGDIESMRKVLQTIGTTRELRQGAENILANPNISDEVKEKVAKMSEYTPETLKKVGLSTNEVIDYYIGEYGEVAGLEKIKSLLDKGEFDGYTEKVAIQQSLIGMYNKLAKFGATEQIRKEALNNAVDVAEQYINQGTSFGRAINAYKLLGSLTTEGRLVWAKRQTNKYVKPAHEKLKENIRELKAELKDAYKQVDYFFEQTLGREETEGQYKEAIAQYQAEIDALKARKPREPKPSKTAYKGVKATREFKESDLANFAKDILAGGLFQDMETMTAPQKLAYGIMEKKPINISEFAKAFGRYLGKKIDPKELESLYVQTRDLLITKDLAFADGLSTNEQLRADLDGLEVANKAKIEELERKKAEAEAKIAAKAKKGEKKEHSEELADFVIKDAKKAMNGAIAKQKTYLDEILKALKEKTADVINKGKKDKIQTAKVSEVEAIKFALDAINNGGADANMWNDAVEQVKAKIKADNDLSQQDKDDLNLYLNDYTTFLYDNLLSENKIFKVIREKLIQSGYGNGTLVNWKQIIEGADGDVNNMREIIQKLVKNQLKDYDNVQVEKVLDAIVYKYDQEINKQRKKIADKYIEKELGDKKSTKKKTAAVQGKIGKLLVENRLGILKDGNNDMLNELAAAKGLKSMSEKDWKRAAELAENVENSADGILKNRAIEEMTAFIASKQPLSFMNTASSLRFAGLLGRVTTVAVNLISGAIEGGLLAGGRAIRGNTSFIKESFKGVSKGGFKDILFGGGINQASKTSVEVNSSGMPYFRALEYYEGKGKKIIKSGKYVGRVLDATDSVFQEMFGSGYDRVYLEKQIKLENPNATKAEIDQMVNDALSKTKYDEFYAQALQDVIKSGQKPTPANVKRRTYEILRESQVSQMAIDLSDLESREKTFKSEFKENKGLATLFGSMLAARSNVSRKAIEPVAEYIFRLNGYNQKQAAELAKKIGDVIPNKIMPFTRGVSNVIEKALEKDIVYGLTKSLIVNLGVNKMPTTTMEEKMAKVRAEEKVKDLATTAIFTNILIYGVGSLLYAASKAWDDDEEKEGRNPEKTGVYPIQSQKTSIGSTSSAKERATPENTLVLFGQKIPLKWLGSIGAELSLTANINKALTKDSKSSGAEKVANAALDISESYMQQSFMMSQNDKQSVVALLRDENVNWDKVEDYLINDMISYGGSYILWSGFVNQSLQGARYLSGDKSYQEAKTISEKLQKQVGLAGITYDNKKPNYMGRPLEATEVNREGIQGFLGMFSKSYKSPTESWVENVGYKESLVSRGSKQLARIKSESFVSPSNEQYDDFTDNTRKLIGKGIEFAYNKRNEVVVPLDTDGGLEVNKKTGKAYTKDEYTNELLNDISNAIEGYKRTELVNRLDVNKYDRDEYLSKLKDYYYKLEDAMYEFYREGFIDTGADKERFSDKVNSILPPPPEE